ncbi:MAG TPA: hypothetical protein VG826_34900 [Pirellulales bacterium]|nr:hypothetical protein [Pirellulales bacterium]
MDTANCPSLLFLLCYDDPAPVVLLTEFEGVYWGLAYATKELAELFVEQSGMALVPRPVTDEDLRTVLAADPTVEGFIVDSVAIGPRSVRLLGRAAFLPPTG